LPSTRAHHEATTVAQQAGNGQGNGQSSSSIPRFVQEDFADATRTVLLVMAGAMGFAGLVALRGLPQRSPVVATELLDTEVTA
jgi:hypothetical protein